MLMDSVLALFITCGATSPKGRGLGIKIHFAWTAKGSHFEERVGESAKKGRCTQSYSGPLIPNLYFAYSTARLSRITLTLIWPG